MLIGAVFVLVYRGPFRPFIRGYMGDWLVVQFIYVIARLWISYRWRYPLAFAILLLSILVEIIQLLSVGSIPRTFAAEVTIGSTFDLGDIAAYALGLLTVLLTERYWKPSAIQAQVV
jgi:hypothetical protein